MISTSGESGRRLSKLIYDGFLASPMVSALSNTNRQRVHCRSNHTFTACTAAELLRKYANLEKNKGILMETVPIVKELGCFALAIALAGWYIAATPRLSANLSRYVPDYHHRRKEILSHKSPLYVNRYGESVLSTRERLSRQSPRSHLWLHDY